MVTSVTRVVEKRRDFVQMPDKTRDEVIERKVSFMHIMRRKWLGNRPLIVS